jgi:hypothetical protein
MVFRDDEGNFGVGAEFIRINHPEHEPVKIASLFYKAEEFNSNTSCLKAALPQLLSEANDKHVYFRSRMRQFKRSGQFYRPLSILAQVTDKVVFVKYLRWVSDNLEGLALDALKRQESIIVEV